MGLSASMWTSVSGLLSHGNKMNVVGNNIANVSTIGFKGQRMDFNDYLYISGGSTSGPVQIGAGVADYAVIGDFSQGSLESTNSVTDLAIDGNGFFKVRQPNSEQCYYTRAGDFYFNADRQLQNPEGYRLQGWKIDNSTRLTFKNDSVNLGTNTANESAFQGTGTPVDIVLDSWYLEPQRTSSVNFTMGLTSDGNSDRSTSTTSPMTALFDQWDATKNPPMADSSYATSSSIKVYDEGGTPHTLTVYYDQVASKATDAEGNVIYEVDGLPAGYTMYEYVVTIPPADDMRSYGGTGFDEETNTFTGGDSTQFYNDPVKGTNKMAGMLMTGHMIFDASGNLVNQTAYTYGANADTPQSDQCQLEPDQLSSWQATKFSSNGLPVFTANFTGQALANSVSELKRDGQSQAQDYLIELDLGLRTRGDWSYAGSLEDLKGMMVDPIVNTETRISLAAKTDYIPATFKPADDKTSASWVYKVSDPANPNGDGKETSTKTSQQPNIYLEIDKKRYEIQSDNKGPKTIWVDPDTRKEVDPNTNKAVLCYLGKDNKPIMQDDKLIVLAEAKSVITQPAVMENGEEKTPAKTEWRFTKPGSDASLTGTDGKNLSADGVVAEFAVKAPREVAYKQDAGSETKFTQATSAEFTIENTQKIIPQTVLNGDHEKMNGTNRVPVDLKNDIYAEVDGAKYFVQYDENTGAIIGISKKPASSYTNLDAVPKEDWEAYKNQPVYFPKATASRKIDYNNAFSTYDDPIRAENASKAGSSSFITQDAGQNGYASGVLSGTNITADGVVYGYYDNGETVPLYQIALYDFHNLQGLRREGGNLYAQTKESGEARQGVAGEAGFGGVKAYNIEGSNVDLSREFVNMITTQRGFQANSKGITTVDTMLETVIGMKR